ncbi:hypothetical protein ACFQ60_24050 [Streptomyces zhihengii]
MWGWSAVQDADRSAPTTVWAEPGEHTEPEEPSLKPTGLAADLLPMPIGYLPGPDVDEFGNDSVLDAERAVALFKEGREDCRASSGVSTRRPSTSWGSRAWPCGATAPRTRAS